MASSSSYVHLVCAMRYCLTISLLEQCHAILPYYSCLLEQSVLSELGVLL
jgi:hypothetical protein